jgi:TP901 family phage tail tape measure protein
MGVQANDRFGFGRQINDMKKIQTAFNTVNSMSGKYSVSTVNSISATEKFSASLAKERVSLSSLLKSSALFNASLKEQIALQRASVVSFGRTANGRASSSVLVPNNAIPRGFRDQVSAATTRVGMFSQAMKSAGNTGGEWARGMQRTGFQITQGIGVPLAAIGAIAAKTFYDVDKQLTNIAKVYDTTASDIGGRQKELDTLRTGSIANAQNLAKQYGVSVKDTLNAESELAATGQKGNDLLAATNEVQRAAILGNLDQEQALKATISMQSIYQEQAKASGNSTQWLADQFNFMNQVENQTSLTMEDMVEAFPKILPVIKTMGGSIQDAAVFLAGFKQNGISAVEGANSFRTGINRLINPAGTVVKALGDLGVQVTDIGEKTGGKPLQMLQLLSQRMEGLNNLQKQQVVGKLFGSYQVARMTALLDSIKGINDNTTQMGRAFEAAGQDASKWSDTSTREMNRLQQSTSQQFKKTIAIIQSQLLAFGEPVLEMATTVLRGFSKVLDIFNNMPSAAKKMLIVGTIATIIGGAVLLVVGAFGNLLYTTLRVAGSIGTAVTQFKVLNREQLVARAAAAETTATQNAQSTSLNVLAQRMSAFTAAAQGAARAQLGLAAATRTGTLTPTIYPSPIGPQRAAVQPPMPLPLSSQLAAGQQAAGGMFVSGNNVYSKASNGARGRVNYYENGVRTAPSTFTNAKTSSDAAAAATKQASATAKTAADSAKIAASQKSATMSANAMTGALMGAALAVPAIAMIRKENGLSATSATMLGLALASVFPVLQKMAVMAKGITMAGMTGGLRAALASATAFLGPLGIALSIATALGVAFYALNKKMTESSRNADIINKSTQTWADTLGYTSTVMATNIDKQGKSAEKQVSNIDKLKNSNKDLYKALGDVENKEQAIARARTEGLKVAADGGGRDAAEAAMRTVLAINGIKGKEQDATVSVNMDVAVANPEEAKKMLIDQTSGLIDDAIKEIDKRTWVSKIFDIGQISDDAEASAKIAAGSFNSAFAKAADTNEQSSMFGSLVKNWNDQSKPVFDDLKNKNKDLFKNLGINNMTDLSKALVQAKKDNEAFSKNVEYGGRSIQSATKLEQQRMQLLKQAGSEGKNVAASERVMAQEIGKSNHLTKDQLKNINSLDDLWKALGLTFNNTSGAENASGAINTVADDTEAAGQEAEDTKQKYDDMRKSMTDALKSSMSGTMDAVYDAFARAREQQQKAQLDKIESDGQSRIDKLDAEAESRDASFDARQKAGEKDFDSRKKGLDAQQKQENKKFESDWDAIMESHAKAFDDRRKAEGDAYDARIKNIEDGIAAEEAAEETRQRIFAAEQARMQRLSEMFNRNVDFNAALNSGNLDEAAKIQNDSSAASMQWSADDTSAVAGSSADKRKAALDEQKTAIEKQKDDALSAIDDLEDREKKQLDDQKDRAQELVDARQQAQSDQLANEQDAWEESLKQEQDKYDKSVDAQKKAIQKQTDAASKAAQDRFDISNRELERELAAQKAMTPRSQAELNAQIAGVQQTYETFGTTYIKPTAQTWGQAFGNEQKWAMQTAANEARDTIKWSEIGSSITDQMAGAFDLNSDQLIQWLKTGVFPGASAPGVTTSGVSTAGSSAGKGQMGRGVNFRHSGGGIGWSSADRVGIPRSAGLYPSEVPAILKRGEFVMNERATQVHGPTLAAMNQGVVRHAGGAIGSGPGTGGLLGAAVGKALAQGIAQQLSQTVSQMVASTAGYGTGSPGKYGNVNLTDEQLTNASTIMNVGKGMGASQRDLVIALMTAMQESNLRNLNHGDRDSVGLFQQRTSQGWGSIEQIMDPQYSARKFFEALFKVKNRDSLAPTVAAQKVQRSAFPSAYAKWESMADAIVNGTPQMMNTAFAGGAMAANTAGLTFKGAATYPAMEALLNRSGVPEQVTATTNGKHATNSLHYKGEAVDFDDFASPKVDTPGLYAIWKWIYENYGSKSSELIYAGPGATSIKNGKPYNYSKATMDAHHNHVHWGMTPSAMASIGIPQLAVGGNIKYDNVLANLHRGETVLTAPLSRQLETGINNISNSGDQVTVNVTLNGANVDPYQVAHEVKSILDERGRRNGGTRVVTRNV